VDDLIEALTILRKYLAKPTHTPTNCAHDVLWVAVDPKTVPPEDVYRLDELGFVPDEDSDGFMSHRFGSC
jgi:hypothetical protein